MSDATAHIVVVLSAYNGAEHIAEQLDSILAQDLAPTKIIVRDDGSSDNTLEVLEPYEAQGLIELVRGENLGVVGSFFDLICRAASCEQVDFIALSDQDDVWHTDKLSRAYEILAAKDNSVPQLYCSEYVFCDAEMEPQERSHLNKVGVNFNNTLYENATSGNTMLFNRALAERVTQAGREGIYTHDWWLALVALALGELTYDDFASLEYRRTGSNASPTGGSTLKLLRYRFKTFFEKGELENITVQLHKLEECFGAELRPADAAVLERFLHGGRFSKAFAPVHLRQKSVDEFAVHLLFLLGLL